MPEEIQPPKTVAEIGIHLVYMAKAQNATNQALSEVKQTLKEMQDTSVSRTEFDKHVEDAHLTLKDHESRLQRLEEGQTIENHSLWSQLRKAIAARIVTIIVALIVAGTLLLIVKLSSPDVLGMGVFK